MLKTWAEVRTFDDIVTDGEKLVVEDVVREMETENTEVCKFLKKEGRFFYYCACGLAESELKDKTLSPANAIYQRHVHVGELDHFCMGNYEACIFKTNKAKR